ncbi:alpha/beta hydrolase [Streptomyces sp. SID14478]|uniref:alpha/beta fold hydrolase n=1 Tax=Streptomyces sp. SID14478 TaxID=2706073 RepID=UPI001940ACDF
MSVDGVSLYHEVYGEPGTSTTVPLLLIPGAYMGTDSMKPWVSAFADTRTVIVFDQQGHGRTPDTSRELTYPAFADDAAALLGALAVERADVMGYSQGGGVALQLALRHPELVNKLVTLSAAYRRDGWSASVVDDVEDADPTGWAGTAVERAFMAHTPDAVAFDTYLRKMRKFGSDDQNISDAEIRSISAKTMVISGDTDDVRPEHALALFRLRGGGDTDTSTSAVGTPAARLVILPTTHVGIFAQSAVLVPMVSAFLDDETPTVPDLF